MTNPNIARPDPLAAIIAFGKPSSPDLPKASWFKAEDIPAVRAAAESLKFSLIELRTEAEKALAIGVNEGVLKGSGRMIVGSVTPEVYRRIEENARQASGTDPAPAAKPDEVANVGAKASGDGKASVGGVSAVPGAGLGVNAALIAGAAKPVASPAPEAAGAPVAPASPTAPWDRLRVGGTVLAAYWNDAREFEGFWLATVKRIEKGEFVLDWFDAPDFPPFKIKSKHIAIPHPEFDVAGK
jgi:hypothetical protein